MAKFIRSSFLISFALIASTWVAIWISISGSSIPVTAGTVANSALVAVLMSVVAGHLLEVWVERVGSVDAQLVKSQEELTSELKHMQKKAEFDSLTSVLNRGAFFKSLEKCRNDNVDGVFLMIDADNFKHINDTFGHSAGDRALRMIADLITINVRGHDLVGRLGGEEFAVFLAGADPSTAVMVGERIRRGVAEFDFWPVDHQRHVLSISVGGAKLLAIDNIQNAVDLADARMYEAKQQGKNCCVIPFPVESSSKADWIYERRAA